MSNEHSENNLNSGEKLNISAEELDVKYGYDLYPERKRTNKSFISDFLYSPYKSNRQMYLCEKNVMKAFQHPVLKLFLGAFKQSKCEINLQRHVSCEYCGPIVHGGYDPLQNQVVICYNNVEHAGLVRSILIHEFLHMFDHCTKKVDFTNIDHLACTEIRAANLTYCSYLSWISGNLSRVFSLKRMHQECVKKRALDSILAVRAVDPEDARKSVDKVFDKCYADMEPIGRRLRNKKYDPDLIYAEGFMFGYD